MRASPFLKSICICCAIVLVACGKRSSASAPDAVPADTASLVMQVARCSKLYTSEYQIHKIVTHDDVLKVQGSFFARDFSMKVPLGDRKIAMPLDATLKAYIDFSSFGEGNVEREGRRIRITLPDPRVVVTSSKIDHRGTKAFVDFPRQNYTDAEMADFAQQGLVSIVQSVPRLGILEQARENAARTLVPMLSRLGYKEEDIVIRFRKDFTAADLPRLVDSKSLKNNYKNR